MADLRVDLIRPLGDDDEAPDAYRAISVSRSNRKDKSMVISLRRTIRVPDNGQVYELPPDMGAFPIYNIEQYESKLPPNLAKKGGVFIPMYQREAMWINFKADEPFAVKVLVGGVNAISGQSLMMDPHEKEKRQKDRLAKGQSIQDYIVPPAQLWLDGLVTQDGKVMQFVAAPVGTHYSVEAQITGKDRIAGVQFEIIPQKQIVRNMVSSHEPTMQIIVKTLTGRTFAFPASPWYTVEEVKHIIQLKTDVPLDQQRLVYAGRQLENDKYLIDYDVKPESNFHLLLRLRGGSTDPNPDSRGINARSEAMREMSLGAGGFINQVIEADTYPADSWDTDKSILLNLQLLDATCFKHTLGIDPPATPITAETYAKHGYPFYKLYEQPSGVFGDFDLKSMAALDEIEGQNAELHKVEKSLAFSSVSAGWKILQGKKFTEVKLNTVDEKSVFFPIRTAVKE